jgi:hypothetical protein
MRTELTFVGGDTAVFEDTATVKLTAHGVEVTERDGAETVRILFPWNRIDRVSQRGPDMSSVYTY